MSDDAGQVLPVLEAQIGEVEEAAGDYVSISGSPDSVARFLRLLINWNDELEAPDAVPR